MASSMGKEALRCAVLCCTRRSKCTKGGLTVRQGAQPLDPAGSWQMVGVGEQASAVERGYDA